MDVKDLRIFVRVAAVQNLTTVAGLLNLSAGTVSKRIQSLEGELGVRLIDRTTRSSRLTDEGRAFLQRAERALAELDLAKDEISAANGQPAGRIKISAPASLSRQIVAPAVLSFSQAYPAIETRVDITDGIVNLNEGGYDAAIRFGALTDSTLKARRLMTDRIILVAAPSYIERRGAPQRPGEITGHDCLVQGDQRTWTLIRGQERASIRVNGRLASDDGSFLQQAALDGAGLLKTSQIAVLDDLTHDRLVHVMPDHVLAEEAAISVVYPQAKHALPRLRAFLDHLATFCREQATAPQSRGRTAAVRHQRSAG